MLELSCQGSKRCSNCNNYNEQQTAACVGKLGKWVCGGELLGYILVLQGQCVIIRHVTIPYHNIMMSESTPQCINFSLARPFPLARSM